MNRMNRKWLTVAALTWMGIFTLYGQEVKTLERIDGSGKTAYVSLETGKQVPDESGSWDIAFNRTTILVKATAVLLKDTVFENVVKKPAAGFKADSEKDKAIPTGSGNGWYTYDMADHSINPIPNRILVVETASGKYAKVEILNYYDKTTHNSAVFSIKYSFL